MTKSKNMKEEGGKDVMQVGNVISWSNHSCHISQRLLFFDIFSIYSRIFGLNLRRAKFSVTQEIYSLRLTSEKATICFAAVYYTICASDSFGEILAKNVSIFTIQDFN